MDKLTTLINSYYDNHALETKYKKAGDKEKAEIKKLMAAAGLTECKTDRVTAQYIVQDRGTFNSEKALGILKSAGITSCIKTVEVLDMEALEGLLYNNLIAPEIVVELRACEVPNPVPTLKVSLNKKKRK